MSIQISKYQVLLKHPTNRRTFPFRRMGTWGAIAAAIVLVMIFGHHARFDASTLYPQGRSDITGYYQFNIADTLAILDEHGNLQGYFDVFQLHGEPKPELNYNITRGFDRKNHLEFETQAIYGKSYRFSGTVERGVGKEPGDYDYLQLSGTLERITSNSVPGKREVDSRHVVFKSLPQDRGGS